MAPILLTRRSVLTGIAASTIPALSYADLYDDYINSTSKQPFVIFLARNGVPGHAFVGIGVQLNESMLVYECFLGYYPAGDDKLAEAKLIFGKTSGALDYKWKDTSWDVSYRKNINYKRKSAALAVADEWRSADPKYNLFALGGKNCSVFAGEVANAIGLKAPAGAGSMLPVDYISKLQQSNL
jgi:hypothetical protein